MYVFTPVFVCLSGEGTFFLMPLAGAVLHHFL